MAVTAKRLSSTGAQSRVIKCAVREQVRAIDEKLSRQAKSWGRNVVVHELPLALSAPGLTLADTQRLVYVAVLRSLHGRGFEARIALEREPPLLYVAWESEILDCEVDAMNSYLRAHAISRAEVDAFVRPAGLRPRPAGDGQGGARPAPARQRPKPGGRGSHGGRRKPDAGEEKQAPGGRVAPLSEAEAALIAGT